MDLAEARAILKNPNASTLHESAAAASYLSSYYAHEGKHLCRPVDLTKDVAPAFTEGGAAVREDLRQSYAAGHGERTPMGRNPGGKVGPEIVAVLEGPITQYDLMTDERGRAVLVRHANVSGVLDPGRTVNGSRFVKDARQRVAAEQKRNKEWAAGIASFWAQKQKQQQKTARA
jgi:hypothetical protein